MEQRATDVASSPCSGGDLPAFEEMLAEGSFQARLARAREAREKALQEQSDAGEDDFILSSGVKPWEKAAAKSAPRAKARMDSGFAPADPAILALENSLRSKRPEITEPREPKAKPLPPTVVPKPADKLPALIPAGHPLPAPVTVAPLQMSRRRKAQIAAGFVAGLFLGVGGAVALLGADPAVRSAAGELNAAGSVDVVPASADPVPALVNPVLVAAPAAFPARGLPDTGAKFVVPSVLGPTATADNAPVPLLSQAVYAASPVLSVAAPSPAASGAGLGATPSLRPTALNWPQRPVLSTLSVVPTEASARLAVVVSAGLPRPAIGSAPNMPDPAFSAGVVPEVTQVSLLSARSAPVVPPLVLASAPTDVAPKIQPLPPAPLPLADVRIHIHAPESVGDGALSGLVDRLGASGYVLGEPTRVSFTISRDNVRFFRKADAEAAHVLAERIGAKARDFTNYEPAPPPGTIEVWLSGRSTKTAAAPKKRKTNRAKATSPQLIELRNRILQQLRNGEHL